MASYRNTPRMVPPIVPLAKESTCLMFKSPTWDGQIRSKFPMFRVFHKVNLQFLVIEIHEIHNVSWKNPWKSLIFHASPLHFWDAFLWNPQAAPPIAASPALCRWPPPYSAPSPLRHPPRPPLVSQGACRLGEPPGIKTWTAWDGFTMFGFRNSYGSSVII